jgi:nucleoredoxin
MRTFSFPLFFALLLMSGAGANEISPIIKQLNGTLVNSRGSKVSIKNLVKKDYILLYYSASWCGPCKKFTPKLVDYYNKNKTKGNFEVVLVSSDSTRSDMLKYMKAGRMAWPAVDFKYLKTSGIQKHGGKGIPCLVLFDKQGKLIAHSYVKNKYYGPGHVLTTLQRELIKAGKGPDFLSTATKNLVSAKGKKVSSYKIKKKDHFLLYYSASWCGPCKKFTPQLVDFYNKHSEEQNFECILVSSDQDKKSMHTYMRDTKMPWPAVDYDYIDRNQMKAYGGNGIPCLVLLDQKGTILSHTYVNGDYLGPKKVLDDFQAMFKATEKVDEEP